MTTFDGTKPSLPELLKDITTGKIQLPDFRRRHMEKKPLVGSDEGAGMAEDPITS